ncbi:hypothetical protein RIF29_03912 [Crotalaria pallida]|uniref:Uncharacterized protein n=1 Tax=Crotalaria pallida TaxID=3830 RepID=A0AAN9J170_CROPI
MAERHNSRRGSDPTKVPSASVVQKSPPAARPTLAKGRRPALVPPKAPAPTIMPKRTAFGSAIRAKVEKGMGKASNWVPSLSATGGPDAGTRGPNPLTSVYSVLNFEQRLRVLAEENAHLKNQLSKSQELFESQLNESRDPYEKMRQKALKHKITSWEQAHEEQFLNIFHH